ncbi:MAG TPA: hypothetical protein VLW84_03580 [Terriglobales bacterium]|nr:hypothetical protein [Terriglobales bacterium]
MSKAALRDSAFELSGEILAEFRAQPGQKAAIFEAIGDEFNSVQIHLPIANFSWNPQRFLAGSLKFNLNLCVKRQIGSCEQTNAALTQPHSAAFNDCPAVFTAIHHANLLVKWMPFPPASASKQHSSRLMPSLLSAKLPEYNLPSVGSPN